MDVSKAPRVLGFDAIGVVESVEMKLLCLIRVTLYITLVHLDQNGSNAEYQLINERLVAKAPKILAPTEQ